MALREAFPELAIDAVEPDSEVAEVAARFFGVPRRDARLQHHTMGGAAFLADSRHSEQVPSCLSSYRTPHWAGAVLFKLM